MLYHKNGVITEDRFQSMTLTQWIFHYIEILKHKNIDAKPMLQKLSDIEVSLQTFYLLVDKEKGPKLIEAINKTRMEQANGEMSKKTSSKNNSSANTNGEEEYEDLLSDEEKELWSFMQDQPLTIKETREMKNTGKFLLPKKSKQDLIDGQYKVVESAKDIVKPKMGLQ